MRLAFLIVEFHDADMDRVVDIQGQFWAEDATTVAQARELYERALSDLQSMRAEHPGMTLGLVSCQQLA